MASTSASARASRSVATAETAAVLISVTAEALSTRQRLAGLRARQQHDALVGVQPARRVAGRDADRLEAVPAVAGRSGRTGIRPISPAASRRLQQDAQRLVHLAAGPRGQGVAHGTGGVRGRPSSRGRPLQRAPGVSSAGRSPARPGAGLAAAPAGATARRGADGQLLGPVLGDRHADDPVDLGAVHGLLLEQQVDQLRELVLVRRGSARRAVCSASRSSLATSASMAAWVDSANGLLDSPLPPPPRNTDPPSG